MRHLLLTNDFPPKVGGIQSYLWELWRRLDSDETFVYAPNFVGAEQFDRGQPFRIERSKRRVFLPTSSLVRDVRELVRRWDIELVVVDPVLPLGIIGRDLGVPYALVAHGAEIALPGRLPFARPVLASVARSAKLVIAAGSYPLAETERAARRRLNSVIIPPGVDTEVFRPLSPAERDSVRAKFSLPTDRNLVLSVSRLVPRKGMDNLIKAVTRASGFVDGIVLAIAGTGRDGGRLKKLAARSGVDVRFLGAVDSDDLPGLYGSADVFAMLCRNRWMGLEQEGFGIVFLEAAATGVPAVAGRSGGSGDAVEHDQTGFIVDPAGYRDAADAIVKVLRDPELARTMGLAARARAEREFAYPMLARRLQGALKTTLDGSQAGTPMVGDETES